MSAVQDGMCSFLLEGAYPTADNCSNTLGGCKLLIVEVTGSNTPKRLRHWHGTGMLLDLGKMLFALEQPFAHTHSDLNSEADPWGDVGPNMVDLL